MKAFSSLIPRGGRVKRWIMIGILYQSILQINGQNINTVAGAGTAGFSGDNALATAAQIFDPGRVTLDKAGNLYIADTYNNRIRKVTAGTQQITTVAGTGAGSFSGDGGLATSATLFHPFSVAVDTGGNLYIADRNNNRIRKVDKSTGNISTIAGLGTGAYSGDNGLASAAELFYPIDIVGDGKGNLFIADQNNNVIRKIVIGTGVITTVAGKGSGAYSGDGGLATSAELFYPTGIAVDTSGNLFIADEGNSAIRKVSKSNGLISTLAGDGNGAYTGDNGAASLAELNNPTGLALDAAGNIFIADQFNNVIREINASTGKITTIVGDGTAAYAGDGAPAISAELNYPSGVAIDLSGNLFIADYANNRIRMVSASTLTGTKGMSFNSNSFTVYPNPALGSISIKSNFVLNTITIYNSIGEVVYTEKTNSTTELIDLSRQPSGLYILKIAAGSFRFLKL